MYLANQTDFWKRLPYRNAIVRRIRLLFPVLFLLFLAMLPPGIARSDFGRDSLAEFWEIPDFFKEIPEQRELSARFTQRVQSAAVPATATSLAPARIAVVYPAIQVSDYWRRSLVALERRLDELGIRYEVTSQFTLPGQEIREQTRQIVEVLKSDPDYLIFTLDALRHKVLVERLIARGRPKIILQNITTPLRAWGRDQPFLYVGFDHATGARLLADHVLETRPQPESFAIFYGPKGYVSHARGEPFRLAMAEQPGKRLVASYYVGFDREKAREAATELLQRHPDLGFIYSCSTDIALGVADAIEAAGLTGKVATNGWGGGTAELDYLSKGRLEATAMRINDDNGVAMAEAISLDRQNRTEEVPLVFSGSFALVSSEDSMQRIEELKRRAFRYSQ